MLANALFALHRLILLVALSVALVVTGFAHRMPASQDAALAFALANGASPADFCGDGPEGSGAHGSGCPACQIAGSADLPPATGKLLDVGFAVLARVIAPRESRAQARVLDPAHRPQGPPVA
jgi:hypothetical protein